ncbi:MAG: radical SAM family heme chaperone HemW [Verrucomicrobia bacterium]|nr:radical SAM family heme chaperone HemW [Verrucomicrobiota bacterium]
MRLYPIRPESNQGSATAAAVRHLYVHIPFCLQICPYCSFYKEASDRNKTQPFLDSLLDELRLAGQELRCETIFFGGGTPTALSIKQLDYLLTGLRRNLDLSALREWTFEMNPATVSHDKARLLLDHGVNRISMGVQSFDPGLLKTLGRVHSAEQVLRSYEILRKAGVRNVNLDFIFGVPGQTPDQWRDTLAEALRLGPEHLSAYCLTYEEDTAYFEKLQAGEYSQDTDQDARFYEVTMETLDHAGYEQYEISNFACPGYECAHNVAYWYGEDYLGLGPSAYSTVGSRRWQNVCDTERYVAAIRSAQLPRVNEEQLDPSTKTAERLAFGLRTRWGVPERELAGVVQELPAMLEQGHLERIGERIRLTARGRLVADSIAELLV